MLSPNHRTHTQRTTVTERFGPFGPLEPIREGGALEGSVEQAARAVLRSSAGSACVCFLRECQCRTAAERAGSVFAPVSVAEVRPLLGEVVRSPRPEVVRTSVRALVAEGHTMQEAFNIRAAERAHHRTVSVGLIGGPAARSYTGRAA